MGDLSYQILFIGVFACVGIFGQLDSKLTPPDYNPYSEEEGDVEATDDKLPGLIEISNNLTSQYASILKYIQDGNRNCDEVESMKSAETKSQFLMLNLTLSELKLLFTQGHRNILDHNTDLINTLESKMKNLSESCSIVLQKDRLEGSRMALKLDQIQEVVVATKQNLSVLIHEKMDALRELLLPKFQLLTDTGNLMNVSNMELKSILNGNLKETKDKLESITTTVHGGVSEQKRNHDLIFAHLESQRMEAGSCNGTMSDVKTALSEQSRMLENMMKGIIDKVNTNTNIITRDDFQEFHSTQGQIKNLLMSGNEFTINHNNFLNKSSNSIQNEIKTCLRNVETTNLELQKLDLKFQDAHQTIVRAIKNLEDLIVEKTRSSKSLNVSYCESLNANHQPTSNLMEQFQLFLKNKTELLEMMIQFQTSKVINATQENKELLQSIFQEMETIKGITGLGDHQPAAKEHLLLATHNAFFNTTLNEIIGSLLQSCTNMTEQANIGCINADKKVEGIQLTLDTTVIDCQKMILTKLDSITKNQNKDQTEANSEFIKQKEAFESKLKTLEENLRNCSGSHQSTQQKLKDLENKLTYELISSRVESKNQFEDLKRNMKFGMEALSQQYHKVYEETRELKANLTRTAVSANTDQESDQAKRIRKHIEDQHCVRTCEECRRNCNTEKDCREPWICSGCELKCAGQGNTNTSKGSSAGTSLRQNSSHKMSSNPSQLPRNYYNNPHTNHRDSRASSNSGGNYAARRPVDRSRRS